MSRKKIKVLHAITRFICGGADENTLFTVNGLDKDRYEVHLMIGNTYEETMIKRLLPDVSLIKITDMVREISPMQDLKALLAMYRIIRSERYDIMHTHTSKAGFLGRLAAYLGGTSHIVHGVHTIPFADVLQPRYNGFFMFLERFAARFTNVFISVGEDLKQRYLDAGIGVPEKYHTVYSGMDLAPFDEAKKMAEDEKRRIRKEMGITDGERCVGIVSRLEPGKGFNFFPAIIEEVVRDYPHVKFIVVGDGSMREALRSEVQEKSLEDHVSFAGFREDVARIIATFDVAIFTSLLEGLPRTVVQYALLGIPIVAFEVGGIREVVRHGENGFIVKEHNVAEFAKMISSILKEPEVAEKMSLPVSKFPRGQWCKDVMVSRIDEIYEKLLNGSKA